MAGSTPDVVKFNVSGRPFSATAANLNLGKHPDALLTRAVLTASDCEEPIYIDGDANLFQYILEIHRLMTVSGACSCRVPTAALKTAVVEEARKFGLLISAENIVDDSVEHESEQQTQGSSVVTYSVDGQIFHVPYPNLRPVLNQNSMLVRLLQAQSNEDVPIVVPDVNVTLFPYVLMLHRHGGCTIPGNIDKKDLLREARQVFGLSASMESIVEEGDVMRDGGKALFGGEQNIKVAEHFQTWSVDQVCDWLPTIQAGRFSAYVSNFRDGAVDGSRLAVSTDESLKELRVNDPKTRRVLLAAIADAHAVPSTPCKVVQQSSDGPSESEVVGEEEEPQDAAALILHEILGANHTTETFTAIIEQWRQKQSQEPTEAAKTKDLFKWSPETSAQEKTGIASKNGILVASRVRPLLANGPDRAAIEAGDFDAVSTCLGKAGSITVHKCGANVRGLVEHKSFATHCTLKQTCNENDVFEVARPLVESSVTHQTNVTLLCYGQTGSGKTHTIKHLAELISQHLFGSLKVHAVAVEAFEVAGGVKGLQQHGSHVYSLNEDDKPELSALEGEDGAVYVGGSNAVSRDAHGKLNLEHCMVARNVGDLEQLFTSAETRRFSKDTFRNAESSRTHAFYRFHVLNLDEVTGTGSCIQLVDLAGSESNKDCLYHDKTRTDERAKINASLMALCTCVQKHAEGSSFVPFRSSKLTQLLRPCFAKSTKLPKGTATVMFLACLSPLATDSQQSLRTLAYTEKMVGAPKVQNATGNSALVGSVKAQLARAIASKEMTQLCGAVYEAKRSKLTKACGVEYQRASEMIKELEAAQMDAQAVSAGA